MTMHEALTELSQAMRGNMKTLRERLKHIAYQHEISKLDSVDAANLLSVAKQMDALLEECEHLISAFAEEGTAFEILHKEIQKAGYGV